MIAALELSDRLLEACKNGTHRDGNAPVMVCKGRRQEDIPDGCAARFEAAGRPHADHQVWLELVHSQVRCDSCRHSAHIVHTMQLALACISVACCPVRTGRIWCKRVKTGGTIPHHCEPHGQ